MLHPVVEPSPGLLDTPDVVFLDATWWNPADPSPRRNARVEYFQQRLAGARFWSLDSVAEPNTLHIPHQLPSPERFATAVAQLGVTRDSHVIVYDVQGAFSAPRTVFTFLVYGHPKVQFLNGGLLAALEAGMPAESGPPIIQKVRALFALRSDVIALKAGFLSNPYTAARNRSVSVFSLTLPPFERIRQVSEARNIPATTVIVDARNPTNFSNGRIPQSASLSWRLLLTSASGPYGSYSRLPVRSEVFAKLSQALDTDQIARIKTGELKIISSCGSGISAAVLWLALRNEGVTAELYDESWSGYILRPDAVIDQPIVTNR